MFKTANHRIAFGLLLIVTGLGVAFEQPGAHWALLGGGIVWIFLA